MFYSFKEYYQLNSSYYTSNMILVGTSVSWTDTRIVVRVPQGASSGFVRIRINGNVDSNQYPFAITFSYRTLKRASPSTYYYVNPGSVSGFTPAIQNAAVSWNNAGSLFRLNYGGISTKTEIAYDYENDIIFGPPSDFSANSMAFTDIWYSSNNPDKILECDSEFNTGYLWTTGTASGDTMNIETIMLHEFGHWVGLDDLYGFLPELGYSQFPSDISPEKKVMFGLNGDVFGNKNLKTLSSADIAGIRWIYTTSGPTVTGITPNLGYDSTSVTITNLTGTNFQTGSNVVLTRSGSANISATGITVVSPNKITCTFLLPALTGSYNVVVVNPNGEEGLLANGFNVITRRDDIPVTGKWNSDLISDVGFFRPINGNWYLDSNKDGIMDITIKYGTFEDIPLVGDWNGDGISEIGVFRPSARQFILNTNPITRITYGLSTDIPIAGDWNGDGISEIGVFRPSARQFILNTNPITRITYGLSTDIPITGDWNGDSISEIGVFRTSSRQFIFNTNPITRITYGMCTDLPLTGDWNGDAISDIGVYRSSARQFILNTNPITRITY